MDTIKLNNKNVYEIEVNDKGETIVFDLSDISLPRKLNEAYEEIGKIQNRLKSQILIIEKKQDGRKKNSLLSNNQLAITAAWEAAFTDMRKAMDKFLGEGGCKKIFGDSNYLEMFDDLFEALNKKQSDGKSFFDKLKLSSDEYIKRIQEKYSKSKEKKDTI